MIINEADIADDFIEHYGKKGMRWGHRKNSSSSKSPDEKKKLSTKQKVAIGVGVAATAAVGAVFVSKNLPRSQSHQIVASFTGPSGVQRHLLAANFIKDHMAQSEMQRQNWRNIRNVRPV